MGCPIPGTCAKNGRGRLSLKGPARGVETGSTGMRSTSLVLRSRTHRTSFPSTPVAASIRLNAGGWPVKTGLPRRKRNNGRCHKPCGFVVSVLEASGHQPRPTGQHIALTSRRDKSRWIKVAKPLLIGPVISSTCGQRRSGGVHWCLPARAPLPQDPAPMALRLAG